MRLYVGTYTDKTESEGIYTLDFDRKTDSFHIISTARSRNPSFLAKRENSLYAASELSETGRIERFVIEEDRSLRHADSVEFPGASCCHATAHPNGLSLYAANYSSGEIAGYALLQDGGFGEQISYIRFEGSGPDKHRQNGPHAHSVNISPNGKHLVAADLGTDKLMVFDIDQNSGALTANPTNPIVNLSPGEGPRHLVFHPQVNRLYAVTELLNNVVVFEYNPATGEITQRQSLPVLPETFSSKSISADIHLSKDCRFLYASNRGWDGITSYAVNDAGDLSSAEHCEGFGTTPRNFAISNDGDYFFIAYQDSDSVAAVFRDKKTGGMKGLAAVISIPSPICVIEDL